MAGFSFRSYTIVVNKLIYFGACVRRNYENSSFRMKIQKESNDIFLSLDSSFFLYNCSAQSELFVAQAPLKVKKRLFPLQLFLFFFLIKRQLQQGEVRLLRQVYTRFPSNLPQQSRQGRRMRSTLHMEIAF